MNKLSKEWYWKTLGEIGECIRGVSYKPENLFKEYTDKSTVLFRANNIFDNQLLLSDLQFVDTNVVKKHQLLKYGDILICMSSGSKHLLGKSVQFLEQDKRYTVGAFCSIYRPNPNVDANFIKFIFQSKEYIRYILKASSGTNINNLKKGDIENFKIPFPPLSVQKQIVAILECAERLKDKRNKANEETDKILQNVFYDMFGDPRKNEKKWKLMKIMDIGEVISGSTPDTNNADYWNGNINWITPAELIDGDNYYYYETRRKITADGLKSIGNRVFPKHTVMLTTRAPIGKVAIAGREMCSNQGFKNIICKDNLINPVYLYVWLLLNKNYLNSIGTGATFKELNKKTVENLSIPVPPLDIQNKFAKIVDTVVSLKDKQKQSTKEINTLFDALMQKAFNGELVV